MAGTSLVALNDHSSSSFSVSSKLMGDLLALLSAVGYAAYTTTLRVMCGGEDERVSMMPLFGYVLWVNFLHLHQ
jgi:drug/metabolite transporter (DMT)-like permease